MTLAEFIIHVRKHFLAIAAATGASFIVALLLMFLQPSEYTAKATLFSLDADATNDDVVSYRLLSADLAVLAQSDSVRERAKAGLGAEAFDGCEIRVTSSTSRRITTLDVTSTDAAKAQRVCNALAHALEGEAAEKLGVAFADSIVEAELPQSPSGPRRMRTSAIVGILGFIAAMLATTTIEWLKDVQGVGK